MGMKVEHSSPFIDSTCDLFSTMLGCKAIRGEVGLAAPEDNPREITALIGLSGWARGMVALAFPVDTALSISNRLLATEKRVVDDIVSDTMAEMVNIVADGAKSKLSGDDRPPIDLSLPTVVRGNNCNVDYPSGAVWLEVPFSSDLGPFTLRVTFEKTDGK